MAKQALRRHDDEGLAQVANHLPPQHVKHLRRRRGHADLDVAIGAELQESLEACRGMLGSLPFVPMREEHHQAADAAPLRLAGADELIDHDLCTVREVAELRLPYDETVGSGRRIAVLES